MRALVLLITFFMLQQGSSVDAPAGTKLLLQLKGSGVQVYACADGKWMLKAPDAKLLDADGKVVGTHFAGPMWHLDDGSEVKGKAVANQPSPDAGSVPWLLLEAVAGSGKGKFEHVAYVRRTETRGGAAPQQACAGGELRVPYSAVYGFYEK